MKKKIIFILILFAPILGFLKVDKVFGCSLVPPHVQININDRECRIYKNLDEPAKQHSISVDSIDANNFSEVCSDLELSEDDEGIILEAIQSNKDNLEFSNHLYIERQNNDEYSNYLKEIEAINSNACSCDKVIPGNR